MMIVHVAGVEEIWKHLYQHNDAHRPNIMIFFAPEHDCNRMKMSPKERKNPKLYVIDDKKCIIWEKKYLLFIDPYHMKDLRSSGDLRYAVDAWFAFKKINLPLNLDKKTANLIKDVDAIVKPVLTSALFPKHLLHAFGKEILEDLKKVQEQYYRYRRIRRTSV